jgi:Protein of unknown function (DUF2726)
MLDLAAMASVAGALLAVACVLLMIERRRRPDGRSAFARHDDALDTIAAWPPQAVRVMTLAERHAYEILRRVMPRHLVLAQVPLARFISVPTLNPYAAWLTRAGRLSVDLLITDTSSRPVAAVQIRSAGESERGVKRHQRLVDVLQAAGVRVHIWPEDNLPSPEEASRQLRGDLTPSMAGAFDALDAPLEVDKNGRRVIPVAQVEELLAEGDHRDYSHDPVASTFFDELDPLEAVAR